MGDPHTIPLGPEEGAPMPFDNNELPDVPIPVDEGHDLNCREIPGKSHGGSSIDGGMRNPAYRENAQTSEMCEK